MQGRSATSTKQLAFASSVAQGALLVAGITTNDGGTDPVSGITDNLNGAWTKLSSVRYGNGHVELYYLANSKAGAVTVSLQGGGAAITIAEYSGVSRSPLDQYSTTAVSGGKITAGPPAERSGRSDTKYPQVTEWSLERHREGLQERRAPVGADSQDAIDRLTYDGNGLRASKTSAGVVEAFKWDVANGLPVLIQDGTTNYVTGPGGLPLEQINGTTVSYYLEDQLGSVRAISDAGGTLVRTYSYDPYGNLIASTGSLNNPFTYAGQYQDLDTGLYYLRARYYDPSTACFISLDPAVATTRQPYGYVADSPLNGGDPSGLDGWGWIQDRLVQVGQALPGPARSAYVSSLSNASTFLGTFANGTTNGVCIGGSYNFGPLQGMGEVCGVISYDSQGNPKGFGTTETLGGGGGLKTSKGGSGSVLISFQRSNARDISDLGGPFVYTNACAGRGPAMGVSGQSGVSSHGVVNIAEVGAGVGVGVSGGVGANNAWTQTWFGS